MKWHMEAVLSCSREPSHRGFNYNCEGGKGDIPVCPCHFDGCHFLTKIEEEERGERRKKGFIVYYSVVSGFFFDVLVSEEATRSKG